jgi:spermidine synthase
MIAHVPLNYFPAEKKLEILIIGGGDGGTAREALKHGNVEKIMLVDIDEEVLGATSVFMPNVGKVLNWKSGEEERREEARKG